MNLKDIGSGIMIGAAVAGIGYGLLTKAGYIIGESQAQSIADASVMSESVERMEFQLEYKLSELRRYYAIEPKSPADLVQIKELEAQIESLRRRIAKARGQE